MTAKRDPFDRMGNELPEQPIDSDRKEKLIRTREGALLRKAPRRRIGLSQRGEAQEGSGKQGHLVSDMSIGIFLRTYLLILGSEEFVDLCERFSFGFGDAALDEVETQEAKYGIEAKHACGCEKVGKAQEGKRD
jgi:hypothetical protein